MLWPGRTETVISMLTLSTNRNSTAFYATNTVTTVNCYRHSILLLESQFISWLFLEDLSKTVTKTSNQIPQRYLSAGIQIKGHKTSLDLPVPASSMEWPHCLFLLSILSKRSLTTKVGCSYHNRRNPQRPQVPQWYRVLFPHVPLGREEWGDYTSMA